MIRNSPSFARRFGGKPQTRRGALGSMLALAPLVLLAGCKRSTGLARVAGHVTWNGKPVVPGSIFFEPVSGETRASSLLALDGGFVLRSYPLGEGAKPGDYTVHLQLGMGAPRELGRFTRPETTPLKVTVADAGLPDYHIELAHYLAAK